jgi:hypothetical protein
MPASRPAATTSRERLGLALTEVDATLDVERPSRRGAPACLDRRAGPSTRASCSAVCLRGRFTSGTMAPWEFERDGEVVRVDTAVPLLARGPAALVEASADSANRNAPIDR